jgi:hypothetical protein
MALIHAVDEAAVPAQNGVIGAAPALAHAELSMSAKC